MIVAAYQVACTILTRARSTPDGEARQRLDEVKRLLQLLDERWKLAGKRGGSQLVLVSFGLLYV